MVKLFIDTSSNQQIKVGLFKDENKDLLVEPVTHKKAQVVLPMIEQLLQKHNLTFQDLTNIQVHQGPGSFTGLRVGVAIANTLGLILKIPINEKPVGEIIEPIYEDPTK